MCTVWTSGYRPVKLLEEILRQEGEQGVFGCADCVVRVPPADPHPVLVAQAIVGEHHPLLCQVVALPALLWRQQPCGF